MARFFGSVLQLMVVGSFVEVALRAGDEAVSADLPNFVAADADAMAGASWAVVGACESPVVFDAVVVHDKLVEDYLQVGEGGHERLHGILNRRSPDRWGAVVYGEASVRGEKSGDTGGVLAAPGGGVERSETLMVAWGGWHGDPFKRTHDSG